MLQKSMIKLLSIADLISITNAILGFLAIIMIFLNEIHYSFSLILLAMIADGIDGLVARKTKHSNLGEYMEAMGDMISLVITPSIFVYRIYINDILLSENIFQPGIILVLGIAVGIFATPALPLPTLAVTALFAILSIGLYASYFRQSQSAADILSSEAVPQNSALFSVFYLSFFLSITIPKSGRTISGIPITTANMCILFALVWWSLQFIFSNKVKRAIPFASTSTG